MKIDDYEVKVDELESQMEQLTQKNKTLEKELINYKTIECPEKKENEINKLKNDIGQTKQLLKAYEDQNLKMAELEKKLRNIKLLHGKEIKMIEEKYKEVCIYS